MSKTKTALLIVGGIAIAGGVAGVTYFAVKQNQKKDAVASAAKAGLPSTVAPLAHDLDKAAPAGSRYYIATPAAPASATRSGGFSGYPVFNKLAGNKEERSRVRDVEPQTRRSDVQQSYAYTGSLNAGQWP